MRVAVRVRRALRDANLQEGLERVGPRFREARRRVVEATEDWDALRERAAAARRLEGERLEQFIAAAKARGAKVFVFDEPKNLRDALLQALREHSGPIIKSKSMVMEELGIRGALEEAGLEVWETDLGERILQLAGMEPFHIVAPVFPLSRARVREILRPWLGEVPDEIPEMVARVRARLRAVLESAEIGLVGANFLVAESGHIVQVENEGNIRWCLSARTRFVVTSTEKIVSSWQALGPLLRVLPRSATGQWAAAGMTIWAPDPETFFFLLRRTADAEILRCIRCAACLSECPVFAVLGGQAYGVYSGPMGILYGLLQGQRDLTALCSLCGRCTEVCPVKIPLHEEIRLARAQALPTWLRGGLVLYFFVLRFPLLFWLTGAFLRLLRPLLRRLPVPWMRGL